MALLWTACGPDLANRSGPPKCHHSTLHVGQIIIPHVPDVVRIWDLSNFTIRMINTNCLCTYINCLQFSSLKKKITFASFLFRVVDKRLACINFIVTIIIIIIPYIYIALFWALKALYIEGVESPQPPPMCSIHLDDATTAILHKNAHQTPAYWWRGGGDEGNQNMGMIRRPWWSTEVNELILPGYRGYTSTLFRRASWDF